MRSAHTHTPAGPPTYFFTVRLHNPRADYLTEHIDVFRHAVRACRQVRPFTIRSSVILPNRVHMIWTLPPADDDYGARWKMIKTTFARHIPQPRRRGRLTGIWQRRYWETLIRGADDFEMYQRLIRDAPVDEGLAKRAEDWPFSSFAAAAPVPVRTTAPVPSAPDQATAGNAM